MNPSKDRIKARIERLGFDGTVGTILEDIQRFTHTPDKVDVAKEDDEEEED